MEDYNSGASGVKSAPNKIQDTGDKGKAIAITFTLYLVPYPWFHSLSGCPGSILIFMNSHVEKIIRRPITIAFYYYYSWSLFCGFGHGFAY